MFNDRDTDKIRAELQRQQQANRDARAEANRPGARSPREVRTQLANAGLRPHGPGTDRRG